MGFKQHATCLRAFVRSVTGCAQVARSGRLFGGGIQNERSVLRIGTRRHEPCFRREQRRSAARRATGQLILRPRCPRPVPPPADRTAQPRRSGRSTRLPFCGTLNEDSAHSCRQCGMENTHDTAGNARRDRPVVRLQQANPSARDELVTLMSGGGRGASHPGSVVPGPTRGSYGDPAR